MQKAFDESAQRAIDHSKAAFDDSAAKAIDRGKEASDDTVARAVLQVRQSAEETAAKTIGLAQQAVDASAAAAIDRAQKAVDGSAARADAVQAADQLAGRLEGLSVQWQRSNDLGERLATWFVPALLVLLLAAAIRGLVPELLRRWRG